MKVPLDQIDLGDRARKNFNPKQLEELADSIKRLGLIHPIVVEEKPEGGYLLIAGERRMRACIIAGIFEVPVTLKEDVSDVDLRMMELEENTKRVDLSWDEQVAILKKLDDLKREVEGEAHGGSHDGQQEGWNMEKLAELTGRSKGGVSQDIKLARTMEERPDIAKQIKHLPKKMAFTKMQRLLEADRYKRAFPDAKVSERFELYQGSCTDLIKHLDEDSVDLLITDPPFGCLTMSQVGVAKGAGYAAEDVNMGNFEDMIHLYAELLPELRRVLKRGAHCYIFHAMESYPELCAMLRREDFVVDDRPIIWYKGQTTSKPSDYHYQPCWESVLFAKNEEQCKSLFSTGPDLIEVAPIYSHNRLHPLEKPQELLEKFIRNSSSVGDTILDCFAGSGSTILAAINLHRRGIGFELDESNYNVARKRLEELGDAKADEAVED